jgi:hypothetical protein
VSDGILRQSKGGRGDVDWIPLKALLIHWSKDDLQAAILLPDGRIIVGSNRTFSSERVLLKLHPGTIVERVPQHDSVINHVTEFD